MASRTKKAAATPRDVGFPAQKEEEEAQIHGGSAIKVVSLQELETGENMVHTRERINSRSSLLALESNDSGRRLRFRAKTVSFCRKSSEKTEASKGKDAYFVVHREG